MCQLDCREQQAFIVLSQEQPSKKAVNCTPFRLLFFLLCIQRKKTKQNPEPSPKPTKPWSSAPPAATGFTPACVLQGPLLRELLSCSRREEAAFPPAVLPGRAHAGTATSRGEDGRGVSSAYRLQQTSPTFVLLCALTRAVSFPPSFSLLSVWAALCVFRRS